MTDPATLSDPDEVLGIILDPARRGSLYPFLHRLRSLAPLHPTGLFPNERAWVVTSYHEMDRLLRSSHLLSDARSAELLSVGEAGARFDAVMQRLLLFMDGDEHARIRNLVSRVFTPRSVEKRLPRIQAVVDQLLDAALGRGNEMDLIADFAYPLPLVVICDMLGVPERDREQFEGWAYDFARRGDVSDITAERIELGERATDAFTDYFSQLIEQRRRSPSDDLLSALVNVEDDRGALSHRDLISTCIILLQAGHETTADLIGMGTLALLEHPDQLALLRAEPERVPAAVEELLRYDTSVQIMQRISTRDERIGDTTVPAGEVFVLLAGAGNRDPDVFEHPDRLDITRHSNPHLSFGLGRHHCLGSSLARSEIRIAIASLLRRLPRLERAVDGPAEFRTSLFLRGLTQLPVRWESGATSATRD